MPVVPMRSGIQEASNHLFQLQGIMLWSAALALAVIFLFALWMVGKKRKSGTGEKAIAEVIWLIVPLLVIVALAVPATRLVTAMSEQAGEGLTIRVTGKQWRWHYDYLSYQKVSDLDVSFDSSLMAGSGKSSTIGVDKPLVVPAGKRVRLLMSSDDGIHAWWVPDLGVKKQVVPGYVNEVWISIPAGKEGRYVGRCGELCSRDRDFMPIVVEAKSESDFSRWLTGERQRQQEWEREEVATQKQRFADLSTALSIGRTVYERRCVMCHQSGGEGLPGMIPSIHASAMGRELSTKDYLDLVIDGRGAMPGSRGVLSSRDMAAVLTYVRNVWGHSAGGIVQPADVAVYQGSQSNNR